MGNDYVEELIGEELGQGFYFSHHGYSADFLPRELDKIADDNWRTFTNMEKVIYFDRDREIIRY